MKISDLSPEELNSFYYDALWWSTAERIRDYLVAGADVNYRGPGYTSPWHNEPPVYQAIRREKPDILELLIEYGVDVNVRAKYRETALVYALHEGMYEMAIMLIEAGADLSVKDYKSRVPLEIAILDGRPARAVVKAIIRRLRKRGAFYQRVKDGKGGCL
jgi:ankyrin repeat protein